MIKFVHHVQLTIPSGEEEKAKKFYIDLCGFNEIEKPENLIKNGGFWLNIGDIQIHIGLQNNINRFDLKAHIAFECHNLLELRKSFESNGYECVVGNEAIPGYIRFTTRDPFGNRLEFLEKLS